MDNIKYLGKKTAAGLPQFIISKMPKHKIYIEPFLGTGAIMQIKKPADINIGIDKDEEILKKIKFDNRYFIVKNDTLKILAALIDKINYNGHNADISYTDLSMFAFIDKIDYGIPIVIYLDPPYLKQTRTSYKNCKYNCELTDDEHIKLLEVLKDITAKYKNVYILLSGYKSNMYMEYLKGWFYFETTTMSRGGKRVESLWCNFNPVEYEKHDYSFVGNNFTDRQRIKRKANRLINKINSLNYDEKRYILDLIQKNFFSTI